MTPLETLSVSLTAFIALSTAVAVVIGHQYYKDIIVDLIISLEKQNDIIRAMQVCVKSERKREGRKPYTWQCSRRKRNINILP